MAAGTPKLEFLSLKTDINDLEDAGVPSGWLTQSGATTPSVYLHSHQTDSCLLTSFLTFVDDRLSVVGFARDIHTCEIYIVMGEKAVKRSIAFYVPYQVSLNSTNEMDWGNERCNDVAVFLNLFRNIRCSVDISAIPFLYAGLDAAEYVDFSHRRSAESRSIWGRSSVVFMAVNGDALLLHSDGSRVAWFQAETNRIIEFGDLTHALQSWVLVSLRGELFCSWNST